MAVVLGARVIEVVRSLALENIPVGVVTPTGDPARPHPPHSSPSCSFPWKESCHGSR